VLAAARQAGRGARPFRVLDTAGDRRLAAALAGPAATVTLLADRPAAAGHLDLEPLWARGVTAIGVPAAHPDLLCEVAALAVRGEVDLHGAAVIVTTDELPTLAARVAAGLGAGRAAVVEFRAS